MSVAIYGVSLAIGGVPFATGRLYFGKYGVAGGSRHLSAGVFQVVSRLVLLAVGHFPLVVADGLYAVVRLSVACFVRFLVKRCCFIFRCVGGEK